MTDRNATTLFHQTAKGVIITKPSSDRPCRSEYR